MKVFLISTLLLALTTFMNVVNGATRMAVIELGSSKATVRRTTTSGEETTVDGVVSFWNALHGYNRKVQQHAGMSLVPDLFSRPDTGIVVGLSGSNIDLDTMPTLYNLMNSDNDNNGVVGHMEVPGHQCHKMIQNGVTEPDVIEQPSSIPSTLQKHTQSSSRGGMSGMEIKVTASNAAEIDTQIAAMLKDMESQTDDSKTIVLHLIVEEEDGSARRRQLARRLEEAEGEGEEEADGDNADGEQENADNGEGDNADGNNNANANGNNANNGYYGYGYYNAYGEWVTPYKTMFQIQYFNVVLWTAVGLVAVLFFSIYLMVYMPLMADTLLFGESARVSQDD